MFLNELKDIAWQSAQIVEEYNPARIRKDACGAWIAYADLIIAIASLDGNWIIFILFRV